MARRFDPRRVAAAQLAARAERHVDGLGDQADTAAALRAALAMEEPAGSEVDAALADLHEVTRDQALLAQAAARFVDDPDRVLVVRLLALAGADVEAASAWRAAHPARGWNTPQADPRQHRRG